MHSVKVYDSCSNRVRLAACFALLVLFQPTVSRGQDDEFELPPPPGTFDPTTTLRVKTNWPILDEQQRMWTDASGKKKVKARLGGRNRTAIIFYREDGERFEVNPEKLSLADRAYAIQKTQQRVNRTAIVYLGQITQVISGDTFEFKTIGDEKFVIRLDGVDAPEPNQQLSDVATKWISRFMGEDLRLEYFERDRDGRLLSQAYVGDRWINYEMVFAGVAWHDHRVNVDRRLSGAQKFAQQNRRGIWKVSGVKPPWEFSGGNQGNTIDRVFNVPK